MTSDQRFLFNRDFDPDLVANGGAHSKERGPNGGRAGSRAKPVFSEDDLARVRAEGYAEGREQASLDAAGSMERRLTEAFETVGDRLGELIAITREASAAQARDANTIAVAIARRMVPELYRRNAAAEIEHTVAGVLAQVLKPEVLTVRTAEALADPLRDRIKALAEARGVGDDVKITADPTLSEGDCRVEWSGGGAERISAALWTEIEAIVEKNLGFVPALTNDGAAADDNRGDVNAEHTTPMLECAATAPSTEIEAGENHG